MGPSCSGDSHERRGPQPAGRGGWPGAGVEQRLASSSAAERCAFALCVPPGARAGVAESVPLPQLCSRSGLTPWPSLLTKTTSWPFLYREIVTA